MLMSVIELTGLKEAFIASKQPMRAFIEINGHIAGARGGCTILISSGYRIVQVIVSLRHSINCLRVVANWLLIISHIQCESQISASLGCACAV